MVNKELRLAVLLSGSGQTLKNILTRIEKGTLSAKVEMVISSRSDVAGVSIAKAAGIPTHVVRAKDFHHSGREGEDNIPDWAAMSRQINDYMLPVKPDLVCMAGYLCRYVVPDELAWRVMNIHPSLLPSFGGQGMFGATVHRAVVKSGVKISGCTVHFVNQEYDAGPIILQRACPVYGLDSPEDVAKRVFAEECVAYPMAIKLFAEGRLNIMSDGRVSVARDKMTRFYNHDD